MSTGRTRFWLDAVSYPVLRAVCFGRIEVAKLWMPGVTKHLILTIHVLTAGIPNVYYFGQEGLHNILVIDLLGPSLEDLFDLCGRRFSIKTVVMVARQMLARVQTIHEKNLIYR